MVFIASTLLTIFTNLLLVFFVIVCLLLSLLILMQRPKQEGLGAAFGGGVTDQVFGARTTNVLQKGTVYLGSLFFILSLTLAILIGKQTKQKTLIDAGEPAAKKVSAVKEKEASIKDAETPTSEKSLTEELPAAEAATDSEKKVTKAVEEIPAPTEEIPAPKEEIPAPAVPEEAPAPTPEGNNSDKPE